MVGTWCSVTPDALNGNINFRRGSYGHMYSRMNEADQIRNVDILFLGSSLAYRGFDPRIFESQGFNTFNLGSSSQTHPQTQVLLNKYLLETKPKLIVYECDPYAFMKDGIESTCDLISNTGITNDLALMAIETKSLKVLNTLTYSAFRSCLNLDSKFVEEKSNEYDTYIKGGYVQNKLIEKEPHFFYPKSKEWIPLEYQISSFTSNLKFIKQNNVPVLLVRSPQSSRIKELWTNEDDIQRFLNSQEVPYLDFSKLEILVDSIHFYDNCHLNQNGVEIFNELFIDKIAPHLNKHIER